jgi:hypothetical protein
MAPLAPLFEFLVHPTCASLEAPLGRDGFALENLASRCDSGAEYRMSVLTIRRKLRFLAIPKYELDTVQRRINALLYPVDQSLGPSPHGYVVRRSPLTNARPHTGARFLQKFDIKDFFANITTSRIEERLSALGFGAEAASMLSRLTSCRGTLPLGARASPRISNIVLIDFDHRMEALALAEGLVYTRYADDLTFSAQNPFNVSESVADEISLAGFELNENKTRSFKHGQPMFVTGLSIEDESYPRVRKRLKARLRQEFYFIERYGLEEHAAFREENSRWTASRLVGEFHYVLTVEPAFAQQLSRLYPAARAAIAPEHSDSRIERAERYRQEFVDDVLRAPVRPLPFYAPFVSMF